MQALKQHWAVLVAGLALGVAGPATAGSFHFPVGFAYTQGAGEILDSLDATWHYDEKFVWPIGLTLSPYYEFDCGLGVGVGLGPTALVFVDDDKYFFKDRFSYAIPVGADVRYTFFRDKNVSPYVRVGFRYPIAGGDDIDGSQPGPFGAAGVEFLRTKKVGVGLEFAYDGSEVTTVGLRGEKDDVTFSGFTVSIQALF